VGDGYLKRALQTRLNDKNISWTEEDRNPSATVVFTSWVTPITLILHGLDIVVLTSLNEGTPLSLIEGQLCGKPVIATDSGGVSDTFVNNESGFLVQNQDKLDFVTKLLLLIQDRDLRARMGSKGSIFIRKQFPKQAEVNAIKKLYADCIRSAKTI
jgi:glycosyltransferase involved in cell wall biosynthesis